MTVRLIRCLFNTHLGLIKGALVSPFAGFLDWVPKKMQRVGCMELLNTVQRRVQPKLHVFGHIHEGTDTSAQY